MGFFGDFLDFNNDGKIDGTERAIGYASFLKFMDRMKDKREAELEEAGLDLTELEFMDEDERREALEDAGLDPDNYEF